MRDYIAFWHRAHMSDDSKSGGSRKDEKKVKLKLTHGQKE